MYEVIWFMERKKIEIAKKGFPKGEYGYKIFSVRIKEGTIKALDGISNQSNRSRLDLSYKLTPMW